MKVLPSSPFQSLSLEETVRHLKRAAQSVSPIFIWSDTHRVQLESRVIDLLQTPTQGTHLGYPLEYWIIVERQSEGRLPIEEQAYPSKKLNQLFRIKGPTATLFGECSLPSVPLDHLDTLRLRIKLPIFSAQRRASFRLPMQESPPIRLLFEIENSQYKTHARIRDLSDGGAGILIEQDPELPSLLPQSRIHRLKFKIGRALIEIPAARIAFHHVGSKSAGGTILHHVGLQFEGVSQTTRTLLSTYIFEKSTQLYGRK